MRRAMSSMSSWSIGNVQPRIAPDVFVAPGAQLIGNVELKAKSSVWFNAVLRGENAAIVVEEGANVQDGTVIHVDPHASCTIGQGTTVGHSCMLHGCTIGQNCLIGIGTIILNGTTIGDNCTSPLLCRTHCFIAANTFIAENKVIPANSFVLGSPGKVKKEVTPEQITMMQMNAAAYITNAKHYIESLKEAKL